MTTNIIRQVFQPTSLGTSTCVVTGYVEPPKEATRLLAVIPSVTLYSYATAGESLTVKYRIRSSLTKPALDTSFLSETIHVGSGYPVPVLEKTKRQMLHGIHVELPKHENYIQIDMNSVKPMTVPPRAGLTLIYGASH